MTDFYPEDGNRLKSKQKQKDLREKALSKAQGKFFGKADLHFDFNETQPITPKRIEPLAKDIAGLGNDIAENFMDKGIVHPYLYSHIPEVRFVYKGPYKCVRGDLKLQQVYSQESLKGERISQIVKKKEEIAKNYKSCDEYWLLIIMDFFDPAQDHEVPDDLEPIQSNIFERVIFWRKDFSKPCDLKWYFANKLSSCYSE